MNFSGNVLIQLTSYPYSRDILFLIGGKNDWLTLPVLHFANSVDQKLVNFPPVIWKNNEAMKLQNANWVQETFPRFVWLFLSSPKTSSPFAQSFWIGPPQKCTRKCGGPNCLSNSSFDCFGSQQLIPLDPVNSYIYIINIINEWMRSWTF